MTETLYKKVGRRYVEAANPMTDIDAHIIIMGGVRYAHGRLSYAPGSIMDWVEKHWGGMGSNTRHLVVKDTIQWLANRYLFSTVGEPSMDYREAWTAFALRLIEREGAEFGRKVVAAALYSQDQRRTPEVQVFLKYLEATK